MNILQGYNNTMLYCIVAISYILGTVLLSLGGNIPTNHKAKKELDGATKEDREVKIELILLTPGIGPISIEERQACREIVNKAGEEIAALLGWEIKAD